MVCALGADPAQRERRRSAGVLDSATLRSLRVFSVAIGCAAALLGGLVLIGGWGLDIHSLRSVQPGPGTMQANAALGIAALGGGLALRGGGRSSRAAAGVMAGLALAIGILTLAEYALDSSAGIDQLLFQDTSAPRTAYPGRPAIATALMATLLAGAQLSTGRPGLQVVKTTGALAAALIAWASLSGYVFGSQALSELPAFSTVALDTDVAMLLLAIGTFAVDPVSWPVRTALGEGIGGTVCRWLLPPAILAPPMLGWLLTHTGISSLPEAFRWALYSVGSSLGSVSLILLLAHRIALIDAERTYATEMSLRDPLTGLANRRAFDAFLSESFRLAKRHHHPLALALIDIDRFKSYNDEYGHPEGDELLKSLGSLLSAVARETDVVARVGGEEFAVALPETDLAGAMVIAERMRAAVERSTLFRRTVTASIGVAAMEAAMEADIVNASALVKACDDALYRAKSGGRNRVSASGLLTGRDACP